MLMSDNQPVTLPADRSDTPDVLVDASDNTDNATAAPAVTAQIFPDDLETELISLNGDGDRLFSSAAIRDLNR
jgi:hypothetical protein